MMTKPPHPRSIMSSSFLQMERFVFMMIGMGTETMTPSELFDVSKTAKTGGLQTGLLTRRSECRLYSSCCSGEHKRLQ